MTVLEVEWLTLFGMEIEFFAESGDVPVEDRFEVF
jgi:hypothetical protein